MNEWRSHLFSAICNRSRCRRRQWRIWKEVLLLPCLTQTTVCHIWKRFGIIENLKMACVVWRMGFFFKIWPKNPKLSLRFSRTSVPKSPHSKAIVHVYIEYTFRIIVHALTYSLATVLKQKPSRSIHTNRLILYVNKMYPVQQTEWQHMYTPNEPKKNQNGRWKKIELKSNLMNDCKKL